MSVDHATSAPSPAESQTAPAFLSVRPGNFVIVRAHPPLFNRTKSGGWARSFGVKEEPETPRSIPSLKSQTRKPVTPRLQGNKKNPARGETGLVMDF